MDNLLLSGLITELYQKVNNLGRLDSNMADQIDLLLESNGLSKDKNVPMWLKNFFQLILQGESTEKFYIDSKLPNNSEADVWNFLVELEDIISFDCDDSGEEIEIIFKSLGVYALISLESGFYQIQSVNNPNCASYANEKFKKFLGESD